MDLPVVITATLSLPDLQSCTASTTLIAIVSCSIVAGVAVVVLFVYLRLKKFMKARSEEETELLSRRRNRDPVYTGL